MRTPTYTTRLWLLLLSTFFLLEGCRKEKVFPNPDLTPYNIQQITVVSSYPDMPPDTYYFTYNGFGEPLTVKHADPGTGHPNAVFQYDKYGRLIVLVRPYENGYYESYSKYFYNDCDQIAGDSTYVFGTYIDSIPGITPQFGGTTTTFKYDGLGRIIQTSFAYFGQSLIPPPPIVETYTYDRFGDQELGGLVYDNRVCYLRTNAVWMFLSTNYSVHNPFKADSYNAYGLPTVFESESPLGQIIDAPGKFTVTYARR